MAAWEKKIKIKYQGKNLKRGRKKEENYIKTGEKAVFFGFRKNKQRLFTGKLSSAGDGGVEDMDTSEGRAMNI